MGDTSVVPDDGVTAGSRTTPSTVPAVRQGAAAARGLLVELAAQKWKADRAKLEVRDGKIINPAGGEITYADLAATDDFGKAAAQAVPGNVELTSVQQWKTLGTSLPRPNRRDIVTGAHRFPSDTIRPGMLYGAILRAPSYGARLAGIDAAPAKAMKDVVVVEDGQFVGVAAPTRARAEEALALLAKSAKWEPAAHPSSKQIFEHLRKTAPEGCRKTRSPMT